MRFLPSPVLPFGSGRTQLFKIFNEANDVQLTSTAKNISGHYCSVNRFDENNKNIYLTQIPRKMAFSHQLHIIIIYQLGHINKFCNYPALKRIILKGNLITNETRTDSGIGCDVFQ